MASSRLDRQMNNGGDLGGVSYRKLEEQVTWVRCSYPDKEGKASALSSKTKKDNQQMLEVVSWQYVTSRNSITNMEEQYH